MLKICSKGFLGHILSANSKLPEGRLHLRVTDLKHLVLVSLVEFVSSFTGEMGRSFPANGKEKRPMSNELKTGNCCSDNIICFKLTS